MAVVIRVFPQVASRPCKFCLSLQEDSVFADFDVDEAGQVFLQRISFDGYGCCDGGFKKMGVSESRLLIESVASGKVQNSEIEQLLRAYFEENVDSIWSDALVSHELL